MKKRLSLILVVVVLAATLGLVLAFNSNADPVLTIKADDFTKTYDGTTDVTGATFSYNAEVLTPGDEVTATVKTDDVFTVSGTLYIDSYKVLREGLDVTEEYNIETDTGVLTQTPVDIKLTAGSAVKTFDGEALTCTDYTISSGALIGDDEITEVVFNEESTITHWQVTPKSNKIESFVVMNGDENATAMYNLSTVDGTLAIEERPVKLTSGYCTKIYDGTPLTYHHVAATGWLDGDGCSYDFTGTQTDAGKSLNKFEARNFTSTREVASYRTDYEITCEYGTLTVVERDVTLTSASDTKKYDGIALTNSTVTIGGYGFAEGEGAEFDVTGTITNAGTTPNAFTYEANAGTNFKNYNIRKNEGTLTVNAREITITAASDTKMYDGKALTNDTYTMTGDGYATGEGAQINVSGSQTHFGSAANKAMLAFNEGTLADNYTVELIDGVLTVTKRDVKLISASNYKPYDGTPLTANMITEDGESSGFVYGEGAIYNVTGSQTERGNSKNTFAIASYLPGTYAADYNITFEEGILAVYAKVSFDSRGGSEVEPIDVRCEEKIYNQIQTPVREDYEFTGWYKNKACSAKWDFATDLVPCEDFTLYAGWVKGAICEQDETCVAAEYEDIDPAAWYHNGVHYVVENNIMFGLEDGTFAPSGEASRAMFVAVLYRLEGSPEVETTATFKDVAPNAWYAKAVAWAEENGIAFGTASDVFAPDKAITREQLVTILYRYAEYKKVDVSARADLSAYTDAEDVGEYALEAMQWAVAEGLITGRTTTELAPTDNATRAEVATIITFYSNFAEDFDV